MCMFHCQKQSSGLWQVISLLMWLFLNAIRYWPSCHVVVCHLYSKKWFSQFNTHIIYFDHISLYPPPHNWTLSFFQSAACTFVCFVVSSGLLHEHKYEIIYLNKGKLPEATTKEFDCPYLTYNCLYFLRGTWGPMSPSPWCNVNGLLQVPPGHVLEDSSSCRSFSSFDSCILCSLDLWMVPGGGW